MTGLTEHPTLLKTEYSQSVLASGTGALLNK